MDKVKEFLKDLHNNWDNSYWWADHQWLMYILLFGIIAGYSMAIEYMRLTMRAKIGGSYNG